MCARGRAENGVVKHMASSVPFRFLNGGMRASRPKDSKRAAGAFAACGPARGRTERPAGILLNINSGLRPPNRHFAAVYHHFTTVTFSVSCQQKS